MLSCTKQQDTPSPTEPRQVNPAPQRSGRCPAEPLTPLFSKAPHGQVPGPWFWIHLTFLSHRPAVAIGKFSVSPMTERTDEGAYRGAVTVSSGQGQASSHRITRFSGHFASPEAARLVALTCGWLQTQGTRLPAG